MIDWQRILLNNRQAGMSVSAQARKVGMSPETLMHYARGEQTDPPFSKALALLDLHYGLCREKHSLSALRIHEGRTAVGARSSADRPIARR